MTRPSNRPSWGPRLLSLELWITPAALLLLALMNPNPRSRMVLFSAALLVTTVRVVLRVAPSWEVGDGMIVMKGGLRGLQAQTDSIFAVPMSRTWTDDRWLLLVVRWSWVAWVTLDKKDDPLQMSILKGGGRVLGAWLENDQVMTRTKRRQSASDSFSE